MDRLKPQLTYSESLHLQQGAALKSGHWKWMTLLDLLDLTWRSTPSVLEYRDGVVTYSEGSSVGYGRYGIG